MRHDSNDHPLATCACGRKMPVGEYVCEVCHRQGIRPEGFAEFGTFIAAPRVKVTRDGLGGGQEVQGLTLCDYCPPAQFRECRECVKAGAPVGCEWVAISDRAQTPVGRGG